MITLDKISIFMSVNLQLILFILFTWKASTNNTAMLIKANTSNNH